MQWRGQYKPDFVLRKYVGFSIFFSCFKTFLSVILVPKGGLIVVGSLFRIADIQFNVVCAIDGEKVLHDSW